MIYFHDNNLSSKHFKRDFSSWCCSKDKMIFHVGWSEVSVKWAWKSKRWKMFILKRSSNCVIRCNQKRLSTRHEEKLQKKVWDFYLMVNFYLINFIELLELRLGELNLVQPSIQKNSELSCRNFLTIFALYYSQKFNIVSLLFHTQRWFSSHKFSSISSNCKQSSRHSRTAPRPIYMAI